MSSQLRSDGGQNREEAAEEEEVLRLEEEVEEMAQKIVDYRTTLPGQLTSSISALLESQRPALPAHLLDEAELQARTLPGTDADAGVTQGLLLFLCILSSNSALICFSYFQVIYMSSSVFARILFDLFLEWDNNKNNHMRFVFLQCTALNSYKETSFLEHDFAVIYIFFSEFYFIRVSEGFVLSTYDDMRVSVA